ncbi:hypothetical protein TSOC_004055 [Tetrabaena socialis]|uniref:phytol kinase n=1 Tax=Tetrabaena socialis TaxID=47790 RepID=A0A2J8A9Z3_9CHLO|nr:hypothetical protein TSOC_004055 [Tetrabaena socialis]|eukprot:PNH09331.1 hypothetical protein TSOC_004055 [Tetrabaena socialis]
MAVPDSLQDATLRLPGFAARLAGVPGAGLPLGAEDAGQLTGMLLNIQDTLLAEPNLRPLATALLSDDQVRLALLRLVAFAARSSPLVSPFCRAADQAVLVTGQLLDLEVSNAWLARTQLDFARKLLRMHTLQCCSLVFSKGAAAVEAMIAGEGVIGGGDAEAAGAPDAVPQAPQGQSDRLVDDLLRAQTYQIVVVSILRLAQWQDGAVRTGFTARQLQQLKEPALLFACELVFALRDSRVLEHCARWALHTQRVEGVGSALEERLPFLGFNKQFQFVTSLAVALKDNAVAAPALREVLSGPCVRHLALSRGLATLCAADGGPSHGLPPELLLRLPILGVGGEELRGMHGRQLSDGSFAVIMLRALEDSTAASASPPRDWRSVVGLLGRIGSLLLTSARAWADEAAEAEAGPQPPPLQLVLDKTALMPVAVPLLEQFQLLVNDQQAAAAGTSAALAEAEAAWWRLAVDVATHCARWAHPKDLRPLAELLCFDSGPIPPHTHGPLPAAVPPVLAAALAGGLLPLWERLLRCAGRRPDCREASLLLKSLGTDAYSHERFCNMLAYGEPRQSAALVATWGKLLRTVAVPQLLSGLREGCAAADTKRTLHATALTSCAALVLHAALERLASAGRHGAAAVDPSPPQLQLARLASYAACEWLPLLACLVREGLPVFQRAPDTEDHDLYQLVQVAAVPIVRWLPVLAQCSKPAQGQAAAAAAAPVAPVRDAGAAEALEEGTVAARIADVLAAADWQQLLLREIGAVALLGAVYEFAGASNPDVVLTSIRPLLPSCCCCVAAACPGEVRQAVLAAAAEAAAAAAEATAAASSGGGRVRAGGSGAGGGRRRGGRGPCGRGGGAGSSHAAAAPLPGWSPQLFQFMEVDMRSRQGVGAMGVAEAVALARQAELWAAGGDKDGAEVVWALGGAEPEVVAVARALVSSPAEARALLRTCANPACDNLAGDSEAGLPLRACGRCGGAWYCRKECLAAHWRSGHREACVGRGVAAAGAVGGGQAAAGSSDL